jgi:hypothetical protein
MKGNYGTNRIPQYCCPNHHEGVRLMTLLCSKKRLVTTSKELKTGSCLAESSKEGYDSENVLLPLMLMNNRNKIKSKY